MSKNAEQLKDHAKPLKPTEFPTCPWQRIGADLFQLNGANYLLVVDYFSRYVEIAKLYSQTSGSVINHRKSVMARHGICEYFHSDGVQISHLVSLKNLQCSTGNLKIITDSRIRSVISKGPKYRFPAHIDFYKCRETIASALNDYCTRWCKREHVESNALNNWKLKIFKIIDERVLFYSNNLDLLPPKSKLSFRYLKQGIQEFHRTYVLAPAYKTANNVVVV